MVSFWTCVMLQSAVVLAQVPQSQDAQPSRPSPERLADLMAQQRRSPRQPLPACKQAFEEWTRGDAANRPLQAFSERVRAVESLGKRISENLRAASTAATRKLVDGLLTSPPATSQPKPAVTVILPAEQL
jgi:hypothetical protein